MADSTNLEKMIKEINRAADTAVAAIKKDTASYIRAELKKAEEQAKQEITAAQFSELDKLNEQMNTDLSVSEKNETQALLRRRNEIAEAVFSEASARIAAFTASESYSDFLKKSAQKLSALLGADSVFYLRPADKALFPALESYGARLAVDPWITLGGIRAENAGKGLIADDTLDSRLAQQRQLFYERSGLSVTL